MILLLATLFSLQAHSQNNLPHSIPHGTWAQGCHIVNDDDVIDVQIQIQNNELAVQAYAYEDENCKIPYIAYEERYSVQNFSRSGNIDLDTLEISYTPLSDEVARALSESAFCGVTDWSDHVKTWVTGESCNDSPLRKKHDIYYQILKIVDDSTLFWGDTNFKLDGSSAAKRPTAYEALSFKLLNKP